MNLKETKVQYREDPRILEALDKICDAEGLGRSSLLRQLVRERIRMEADQATEKLLKRIK